MRLCEHIVDTIPGPIGPDGKGGETRKVSVILCGEKESRTYKVKYFSREEPGYLPLCERHANSMSKTMYEVAEISEEEFLASLLLRI